MSFLLQVSNATEQDSVAAAIEWQRKLEAAEALLALKTCQAPPALAPLQKHGNMSGNCLLERGTGGGGHWEIGDIVVNWLYLGTLSLNCLGLDT